MTGHSVVRIVAEQPSHSNQLALFAHTQPPESRIDAEDSVPPPHL
jgi:hypothetical protein